MANMSKIEPKLRQIPNTPGVYRFLSEAGQVLYVGKSLHLRNRVRSYFVPSQKWEKVQEMLPFIDDLEVTPCDTHLEARLLECELIKTIEPRFNAQYKGDARYIYLTFAPERLPKVTNQRMANSVGPFRSQWNLRHFLDNLKLIYPLRDQLATVTFDYQPLPVRLNEADLRSTCEVLEGVFREKAMCEKFLLSVEEKMRGAAENLLFEQAAFYKTLLPTLRGILKHVGALANFLREDYYVAIPLAKGTRHFFISDGVVVDSRYEAPGEEFNLDLFLFMAKALPTRPLSEKALLDYRDIVFTELENMPEDQVRDLRK